MKTVGSCVGLSRRTEVLLMTLASVCFNMFDMSLLELGSNMQKIWSITLDESMFPEITQHNIKSFLAAVVLVRSFTLHLYITLSIAMLWPAINGDRPGICLPWLLVSGVKNLGTSLVSFAAGLFICATYGTNRPACIVFSLGQLWDIAPSLYMWLVVLGMYRELSAAQAAALRSAAMSGNHLSEKMEEMEMLMAVRRRKARSLTEEAVLRRQIEHRRKYTGTSALGLEDFFRPVCWTNLDRGSRSLDTLLEIMAAEAELLEGEDEDDVATPGEDAFEEGLSPMQRTMRLLGITDSQVQLARANRMVPKANFPRMKLKHPKSMKLSDPISKTQDKPGTSGLKCPKGKLLAETTLYTAPAKTIRPTKSELKSPKDFLKLKSPADFMNSAPETEICSVNIHSSLADSIDSEEEANATKAVKNAGLRSKLPRRVLRENDSPKIEAVSQNTSKTRPCLKKAKRIEEVKRKFFAAEQLQLHSFKKKTSKVNFAPSLETHFQNIIDTSQARFKFRFYRPEQYDDIVQEKNMINALQQQDSRRDLSLSKFDTDKYILDDSRASTNLSINRTDSESSSSQLTTATGRQTSERSAGRTDTSIDAKIIKTKLCLSERLFEYKPPLTDIPILVPVTPSGQLSQIFLEENETFLQKIMADDYFSNVKNKDDSKKTEPAPVNTTEVPLSPDSQCLAVSPEKKADEPITTPGGALENIVEKVDSPESHPVVDIALQPTPVKTEILDKKLVELSDITTHFKHELSAATRGLLSRINDSNIRDLCQQLIVAISHCEEGQTTNASKNNSELATVEPSIHKEPTDDTTIGVTVTTSEVERPEPEATELDALIRKLSGVADMPTTGGDGFQNARKASLGSITQSDPTLEEPDNKATDDILAILTENNNRIFKLLPNRSADNVKTDDDDQEKVSNSSGSGKVMSEVGCQACTLSRRILLSAPEEVVKELQTKDNVQKMKKSRTISIKPPNEVNSPTDRPIFDKEDKPTIRFKPRRRSRSPQSREASPPSSLPREPSPPVTMSRTPSPRSRSRSPRAPPGSPGKPHSGQLSARVPNRDIYEVIKLCPHPDSGFAAAGAPSAADRSSEYGTVRLYAKKKKLRIK